MKKLSIFSCLVFLISFMAMSAFAGNFYVCKTSDAASIDTLYISYQNPDKTYGPTDKYPGPAPKQITIPVYLSRDSSNLAGITMVEIKKASVNISSEWAAYPFPGKSKILLWGSGSSTVGSVGVSTFPATLPVDMAMIIKPGANKITWAR